MKVIMLTGPGCSMCATMARLLGDRVTIESVNERPDLLALTGLQSVPQYVILDGEQYVDAFAGMMPVSIWERRLARYESR